MSHVLAVLEQRDGALRKVSYEVVTGARRLADALGGSVDALILASGNVKGAEQVGRYGADKVITLTNPAFGMYAPEGSARTIAERIGQPPGARHYLVRHLAQRAVSLLEHREDVAHRTLASSRSRRTSSGTAAAPSPTIFPSLRSAGGVRARISSAPGTNAVGFTSSGFFFAAMIPLSAG